MSHESKSCIRNMRYAGHPNWAELWQRAMDAAAMVPYLLRHIEALGGDAEAALENARLSLQLTNGETRP